MAPSAPGQPAEHQLGVDPASRQRGRALLDSDPQAVAALEVWAEGLENAKRPTCILKADRAWQSYREMAHYYCVRTLVYWMHRQNLDLLAELKADLVAARRSTWLNMGGQLMREQDLQGLVSGIVEEKISSWQQLHEAYDKLWEQYPRHKAEHALAVLYDLHDLPAGSLAAPQWLDFLQQAVVTGYRIAERTAQSREKDYQDPFRQALYENLAEMEAVLGSLEDNGFIQLVRQQAEKFDQDVQVIMKSEKEPKAAEKVSR